MHYRTVPMPSPAGTNHAGLFMRVPIPSLAYDSVRGLREEDQYEDEMPDRTPDRLPDGFMDRMVKVFSNLPLTPDDIEKLRQLVEDLSNPGALDTRRFASEEFQGRPRPGGTMDQKRRASLGMDARSLAAFYARFPQAARILVR